MGVFFHHYWGLPDFKQIIILSVYNSPTIYCLFFKFKIMNHQVLILLFFVFSITYSQSPISNLVNQTETIYAIIDSSNSLDENASGSDLIWNFTTLSQVGTNTDTNSSPTSEELSDYPNTTEVLTITSSDTPPIENKLFIRDDSDEISLTGVTQGTNLSLEFIDNATLGTFPLNFNYSNSDDTYGNFSGAYEGTNISGTFTGTLETDVDAYGTLTLNDFGSGAYNGNVTRLKTQLNISLNVTIINIGTASITNYYYYDDITGQLVFRTSTNIIDIDSFGTVINETVIVYEALNQNILNTDEHTHLNNTIHIFPNPATNLLKFDKPENIKIEKIKVSDLRGRIFEVPFDSIDTIDISNLLPGIYFIHIHTEANVYSQKIIKK